MLIDRRRKEIHVKIVYYGPALSGKTTNLKYIYKKLSPKFRGEMVMVDTKGERTLYFDFLPVEIKVQKGFKVKFHLYTVPGQEFYKSSRRLVLKGADGIVFVADSAVDRREANIKIMNEMVETLKEFKTPIETLAFVIQYNKRDLPSVLDIQTLQSDLNFLGVPYYEAIAKDGIEVFPTLDGVIKQVMRNITKKARVG